MFTSLFYGISFKRCSFLKTWRQGTWWPDIVGLVDGLVWCNEDEVGVHWGHCQVRKLSLLHAGNKFIL